MALTTMMQQYLAIKDQYKDAIVFFRLGDFYEMFYDDAITASRELELTLTGRDCGMPERAPMCGVPYHAVESYLAKLIQKGYHVAICEQMTPPGKRELVRRQVVRLVTPGTVTENSILVEDRNNYLLSAYCNDDGIGVAWADISTGEFYYVSLGSRGGAKFSELLCRIEPSEIICNAEMKTESTRLSAVKNNAVCPFGTYRAEAFGYANALEKLKALLPANDLAAIADRRCVCAAGALVSYIEENQQCALKNFSTIVCDEAGKYMSIDANSRRTLELTKPLTESGKNSSLFRCLDRTRTGMGSRLLKKMIEQPETDLGVIHARQLLVGELVNEPVLCKKLHDLLGATYDIERLSGRLSFKKIVPVDFLALGRSLRNVKEIKEALAECNSALAHSLAADMQDFTEECDLIDKAIYDRNGRDEDEKNKKRIFNDGYDATLDEARTLITNARTVLAEMVSAEKEATGIRGLKLGFNNVFGYYFEVSKGQIEQVPYRFIRKQTVANGERYVTEELKTLEEKILGAQETLEKREETLYQALMERLSARIHDYLSTARRVATLDCLISLAIVAKDNGYVMPTVNDDCVLRIREGRHPIVEKLLRDESFVPNDTYVDGTDSRIMLITGPNMAGKSIYMKQVALITIMAQMGGFIPAAEGTIGVVDRIFTRVGAGDDLATGRSTFMVEMSEVADILQNVTDKSLILMDEIGRGTSTFDGLSIAWAIIEYLSAHCNAKVLFSTHYHELTDLEGLLGGIKNYKLTVREFNDTIVFLRKLMRGSANRSFGIEVAALAGLPKDVITRAKDILKMLENADLGKSAVHGDNKQLSLFMPDTRGAEVLRILRDLDVDTVSPRAALDILADLKEKAETDK